MRSLDEGSASGIALKLVAAVFAAVSLFLVTGVGQAQQTQGILEFSVNDDSSGSGPNDVDCANAQFETIQEAVNAASAGETISVCAGTYDENVNVNKALTIDGAQSGVDARDRDEDDESVVQATANVVFTIAADNVEINGFTVQGTGSGTDVVGISAPGNVSGYNIFNNIVQDNTFGIYANGNFGQIENNLIRDNSRGGSAAGNGIYSDQGANNLDVNENEISGEHENTAILFTTNGGSAPNNTNIQITNNDITGNRILLFYTDDSLVQGNTITDSLFSGVQIAGGNDGITVRDNDISGSGAITEDQFPFPAVRITESVGAGLANADTEITGNNLVNNDAGISVRDSDVVTGTVEVHQNRIVGNDIGIDNGDDGDDDAEINAENNWWGCNQGPNNGQCDTTDGDNIDARPWIVMTISGPDSIRTGGKANIVVRFLLNRGNDPIAVARQFPDGVPVVFTVERGNLDGMRRAETEDGVVRKEFTSNARNRTAVVTATTDEQTVRKTIRVLAPR